MDINNYDWKDITITIMKDLSKNSNGRKYFSLDKDILPLFIQTYPDLEELENNRKEIEKHLQHLDLFQHHHSNKNLYCLIKRFRRGSNITESKCNNNKKSQKKRKPQSLWCHQCKQKHNDILYCSKFYSGSCTKKYCKGCIERHYNESFCNIDKDKWICLFCRNLCVCAFCRRKRGEDVPKKVFKKRKCSVKDSPPSSPPLKKKRKLKYRESVTESPKTPNSPPTPPIHKDSRSIEFDSSVDSPLPPNMIINNQKNINTPIKRSKAPPQKPPAKMIKFPVDISINHLLNNKHIKVGDKLVLIQSKIFIGEILENGLIQLGWTDHIVTNIPSFTECCGIKYTEECWDFIYCNGFKLRHYIELCYQNEDFSNFPNLNNNDQQCYIESYEQGLDFDIDQSMDYADNKDQNNRNRDFDLSSGVSSDDILCYSQEIFISNFYPNYESIFNDDFSTFMKDENTFIFA